MTAAGIVLGALVIIPDGAQTKRMALLRGANREGGWLLRGLLLALAGSLVTLLIQRLT